MRPTLWSEIALFLAAHRIGPASRLLNPEQYVAYRRSTGPLEVDIIAGCFTVFDRGLFQHLGGFDEHYFLCGADFDLGARAVEAGAAPVVVPVHPILHRSGASFVTGADSRVTYLRGRAQYQRRWWSARRAVAARVIRASAVLARLMALRMLRSARVDELTTIWSRREEWG
jgi:N-acetylglucosaminyl-diphospho-decaprenol L-rhamnosyltransferase